MSNSLYTAYINEVVSTKAFTVLFLEDGEGISKKLLQQQQNKLYQLHECYYINSTE